MLHRWLALDASDGSWKSHSTSVRGSLASRIWKIFIRKGNNLGLHYVARPTNNISDHRAFSLRSKFQGQVLTASQAFAFCRLWDNQPNFHGTLHEIWKSGSFHRCWCIFTVALLGLQASRVLEYHYVITTIFELYVVHNFSSPIFNSTPPSDFFQTKQRSCRERKVCVPDLPPSWGSLPMKMKFFLIFVSRLRDL